MACENSFFMLMFSLLKNDTMYSADATVLAKARAMADRMDLADENDDDQMDESAMTARQEAC